MKKRIMIDNMYTWQNLPSGLDGKTIDRILHEDLGMFFKMKDDFFFLPIKLDEETNAEEKEVKK